MDCNLCLYGQARYSASTKFVLCLSTVCIQIAAGQLFRAPPTSTSASSQRIGPRRQSFYTHRQGDHQA